MEVNAQIIKKNGKKEFVVLSYEEFQKMKEEIDLYEDLRCLREAKLTERDAPTIGIAELKKRTSRQKIKSSNPLIKK
jgi:PHD/YefM family antitoxin component YafN of YafNO toxin-antitoxin module